MWTLFVDARAIYEELRVVGLMFAAARFEDHEEAWWSELAFRSWSLLDEATKVDLQYREVGPWMDDGVLCADWDEDLTLLMPLAYGLALRVQRYVDNVAKLSDRPRGRPSLN